VTVPISSGRARTPAALRPGGDDAEKSVPSGAMSWFRKVRPGATSALGTGTGLPNVNVGLANRRPRLLSDDRHFFASSYNLPDHA
jgi:hypothetical protein